jgi:dihydroorotate dehydrogenase (NAD+) catalytic subunit
VVNQPDISVNIAGLKFKNPVIVASGTFGYGLEYMDYFDTSLLGGIVTKGITLEERPGNPPPRLFETPSGILNSIGLENPGADKFLEKYLPEITDKIQTNIIVNIAGAKVEQYAQLAARLDGIDGINALEINISCPNVKNGGMAFGAVPETAAQVVKTVRKETSLPIIAKLSPNVTDIIEIAKAVEDAGADAISLINTLLGMAVDVEKEKPVLGNVFGGLSGPAVKPVALRAVWQVSQNVQVPLIGMGGITDTKDALEFILAGASIVSIGTGNFINPLASVEIISGIKKYLEEKEYKSINEMIGKAWKE